MVKFICGCLSHLNLPIPDRRLLATFDGVSVDAEGFIQCSIHHQRRYGWRSPLFGSNSTLTDVELERQVVWGIPAFRHPVEITRSVQRDLRPFIYEGMMDEIAVQAIARAHRPVGDSNLGSAESWTPTISLDSSSANGRNG